MVQTNNPIDIKNLDFPEIKRSLIKFLESTTEFKNFNFEGSNINAMLDVLAYNTYYMSLYMNMLFGETFVDSATQRSSLVSALKPIGFVPKSVTAAKLLVSIAIPAKIGEQQTQILLPPYSSFVGGGFNFVNLDPCTLVLRDDIFTATDVLLHQGTVNSYRFIVEDPNDFFIIPSSKIDTTSLKVRVFPSLTVYEQTKNNANLDKVYTEAKDLFSKDSEAQVFFIQEDNVTGYFSLFFGDGTIGKQLSTGNIIETTYITSEGKDGNGIYGVVFYRTHNGESTIGGYSTSDITISTPSPEVKSFDGSSRQSNDFLRKFGPYHFEAQDRLVTENDYEYALNSFFSNVQCCKVWGGEDNDPPYYASAMAMVKLTGQEILSPLQKTMVTQYIKSQCVVGTDFILVDPNVIYPIVSLSIRIPSRYVSALYYLENRINTFIRNYCLSSSISEYRPSDLSYFLKDQESLLKSVNVTTKLKKNVYYTLGLVETHTVYFRQTLVPGTLKSSFDFSLYPEFPAGFSEQFLDDGGGKILYQKTYVDTDIPTESIQVGSVDYLTGTVLFNDLTISSNSSGTPSFYLLVDPYEIDLFAEQHTLLVLEPENITFSLNLDR